MNATTQTMHPHSFRGSLVRWSSHTSVIEAVVAVAVIALAIVGLAGVYSVTLAAIATILTAAAILVEGGASEAASESAGESRLGYFNGSLSAEMLGALAGIILGVLALMGVTSITLLAVAVLVLGVTFLLSGAITGQSRFLRGAMDAHVFLGLSVSVLGLLAVIGISSLSLVLVGLLVLGVAGLFAGLAKSGRMGLSPEANS